MKKLFFLLTAFTLVLSCSSDETSTPVTPPPAPIVKYTIILSAGEGGTVSTTGGEYESGQTVTVTATPQGEYLFKDWSDGNTNATRTITVSSNSTLTANFEKKKYPLTVNIEGEGEVIEEIVNAGRTTDYDSGTTVKLTAVPAEGWEFVGWTGAIESTELEVQLLVSGAKEVNGEFKRSAFVRKNERYSAINETTGYYGKSKNFLRYISLSETKILNESLNSHWFDNLDSVTGDFDGDGFLDLFLFGMHENIWGCCHTNGSYFIILDYFNKTAPYEVISHPASIEFAAGGVELQDINGDGKDEILIYNTNIHQVQSFGAAAGFSISGQKPDEKGIIILEISNDLVINEREVGHPKTHHGGTSGDIDNDGDIDIISWPTGHPNNKLIIEKWPTILVNDGIGNFVEKKLFKEAEELEGYWWSFGLTSINLFDINDDGYLDLIGGLSVGTEGEPLPVIPGINFMETKDPFILWGDGSGQYSFNEMQYIKIKNENGFGLTMLGAGFSDFDLDGDIDIIIQSTRSEINGSFNDRPATAYFSYNLTMLENIGEKLFEDVTISKIEGFYHINVEHMGSMREMVFTDIDNDGDFDMNTRDPTVFCCKSGGYNFAENLYWENVGGSFIRKIIY